MASSCSAIEQMTEEPQGEQIIAATTASQYRKELAENKTARGVELTASQREMRERKLAAYDASMKATDKRVRLGKWTEGLGEEKDAEEILSKSRVSKLRKELADENLCGQGTYLNREDTA